MQSQLNFPQKNSAGHFAPKKVFCPYLLGQFAWK